MDGLDLDLTGISRRLSEKNPEYTRIIVEPASKPGMTLRVVVETTREEMAKTGGRLQLQDQDIPQNARLETVLRFLDQKPGERIKVQMKRTPPSDGEA